MTYLKNFVILLSCILLSPSVEAGFFDEDIDLEERLGNAVCVILNVKTDSLFEEDRDHYRDIEAIRISSEVKSSETELTDQIKALGKRYTDRAHLVMELLRSIEDQSPTAARYRAHFMLDNIGLLEGDSPFVAFNLIQHWLERKPDDFMMKALLFHYFMQEPSPEINTFVYELYGKLVAGVAFLDKKEAENKLHKRWKRRADRPDVQLLKIANRALHINFDIVLVAKRPREYSFSSSPATCSSSNAPPR